MRHAYSRVRDAYSRVRDAYSRMHTGGRDLNLLPQKPIESFWDGLWLGIQPLLCFIPESRIVVSGRLLVVEN